MTESQVPSYEFEQFFAIRRYGQHISFSPDGGQVAFTTDTSGQFNLWRMSTAGGWPHQMTMFDDKSVRTVAWSPEGDTIAFLADQDGDEFDQLYLISSGGGWPKQMTDGHQVKHFITPDAWSPDGKSLVYSANSRVPTDIDVFVMDVETGNSQPILALGASLYPLGWSPDGRYIVIVQHVTNTDTNLYLYDVQAQTATNITEHEGESIYYPGPWLPDGSGLYVISDEGRSFKGLAVYSIDSGERSWIEKLNWDIEDVDVSPDGRYVVRHVNEQGFSKLKLQDETAGTDAELTQIPPGVIAGVRFSPDGNYLGFLHRGPDHAGDIYVLDMKSLQVKRLTFGMLGGIPGEHLVEPELIEWEGDGGLTVTGLLYKPRDLPEGAKAPVVMSIHGGPETQERSGYQPLYQYLLNRGIAILAPNVRGSTGFGKEFQKLIHRDWGGGELKDLEVGAQKLQSLNWVDSDHLGVFGGSFGGFATLSCVTRLPEYWAAAVDIVGPSNLVTFTQAVPPAWRRVMKSWVGDPEADREFLLERSPITYVDQIKAPLLVIQGAKDPRVVKSESDQMVEKIRANGGDVEYMVFEDEGHGFTRRSNTLKAFRRTAEFFERYLLGSER